MQSARYVRVVHTSPPQAGTVKLQFSNNLDFREHAPRRRRSFFKRNAETIMAVVTLTAVITALYIIAPIALDRELRRQEIVHQVNCEQYGESMNAWATERGYEKPCTI